jgi:hypothetical protein
MSNIKNSHIQGDLTISSNVNEIGVINTNFLEETTSSQGIVITNSNLKIKSNLQFTNNTAFSTNLSLEEDNIFTLQNTSGNINIFSKGGKGLSIDETTGNITLTSTTDSISNTTGGLITNGGILVGKTLNVKENINGLDGLHTLTNTSASQNVLDIKSTSNSGKSSISFKDSLDTVKLDIGYGNSTVASPLTNTSYIQSIGGSNLLLRGNSTDSILIDTSGGVEFYNTTSSSSTTVGSVKFRGGISISNSTEANSISNGGSLTIGGGLAIGKNVYFGGSLNLTGQTVSSPDNGIARIYIDSMDNLLKSKDSTNTVTVYQPTNTKGDIISHNGTIAIRIPAGRQGEILSVNKNTDSGLKWESVKVLFNYVLLGVDKRINVIENPYGSFLFLTYPLIEDGSSCLILSSKSYASINGTSIRLNSNPSLINPGNIYPIYPPYKGLQVAKTYTEADGNYIGVSNLNFTSYPITLNSTTWVDIDIQETYGCYFLSVNSENGFSSCFFMISKADPLLSSGNVARLCLTESLNGNRIQIRWQANSFPQIRKINNTDNGVYDIVDHFENMKESISLGLSGTSRANISSSVLKYYQNRTIIFKISSTIPDSPNGIFTISKNSPTRNGNVSYVRSPGKTTGELINIHWDSQNFLQVSKTGNGYTGTYDIVFLA